MENKHLHVQFLVRFLADSIIFDQMFRSDCGTVSFAQLLHLETKNETPISLFFTKSIVLVAAPKVSDIPSPEVTLVMVIQLLLEFRSAGSLY